MRLQLTKTLELIYFSVILPSALYCIVVWGNSSRFHEVNKIYAKAARFIKWLPKKMFHHKKATIILHLCWKAEIEQFALHKEQI